MSLPVKIQNTILSENLIGQPIILIPIKNSCNKLFVVQNNEWDFLLEIPF